MRKLFKISACFLLIVLCTACNGNITRELRHDDFSMGDKFICDNYYPKSKSDSDYSKIKYFLDGYFVDTNGLLYEVSMGQKFSNDQNCRQADFLYTVDGVFDENIVRSTVNGYYHLTASDTFAKYSQVDYNDEKIGLYDILLSDHSVLKVRTVDESAGRYYALKDDGNIYEYIVLKDNNGPYYLASINIVYDKSNYDSNIIDFNYAGNDVSTYIMTYNKIYRMMITNKEACKKYVDINCTFELKEDEVLSKYKDIIIGYNGNTLITNYKQVFTASK